MKGKSLLAACLIVLLASTSIGLYLLANEAKLRVDRYGFLTPYNDHLLVQFGQHIVWLNTDAQQTHSVDLSGLGVNAVGDIGEFSNGDLLVYHRPHEPGFWHNLMSWLRLQNTQPRTLQTGEGLRRCNAYQCEPFTQALPAFDGAFRLVIEPLSQRVHIANTGEFRLYLLDQYGELLAQSDTQTLRFPNQLLLRDDELWVADTNHHRLAQLSTQVADYGSVERSLKLPVSNGHRWPHQMAWDGSNWWINVGDHNLSRGQLLKIDQHGKRLDHFSSPSLNDPLAMAWFAQSLWLTDYQSPQLLRIDAHKNLLLGAESETLRRLESDSQTQLAHWQRLSQLALGGFILVLAGGFLAAWKLEREQTRNVLQNTVQNNTKQLVEQPAKPLPDGQTLWLRNHLARLRPWLLTGIALLALCLLILASQLAGADVPWPLKLSFAAMVVVLLNVLASTAWLITALSRQRIGITEQYFFLEQDPSRRVKLRPEQLSYGPFTLASEQACITLGNGVWWVFDRKQLRQHLYPRLKHAHKQSPWAMQGKLWRCRHPQTLVTVWQLVGVLPIIIAALSL